MTPDPPAPNPTLELLAAHRSIRRYRDEPLDDRAVETAVRAAQMASSSSNVQAYSLLRVRDPQRREQLAEWTGGQPQVARAGAFFVVSGDQRRHALAARRRGGTYAPNLETFLLAVVDASLFAQNLVVAFESQGLGVCYVGGLRNRIGEVDALLELPEGVLPLYGLCVGAPDEDPGQRPRLPLEAVLFDERYPTDEELLAALEAYDARMGEYYEERGKPGYDWSGAVAAKFREPRRGHLAAFYARKGARFE